MDELLHGIARRYSQHDWALPWTIVLGSVLLVILLALLLRVFFPIKSQSLSSDPKLTAPATHDDIVGTLARKV